MGILTARLREKRGQYLSVDWETWQKRVLDMYQASSKVPVTTETALGLPAFYDCVRILAEDSAKLPLPLMQRVGPRQRRQAEEHPSYTLMHDSPNDEMTAQEYREALMVGTLCRGTGYGFIVWNAGGYPEEIWPLNSASMKLYRGKTLKEILERSIRFEDDELVYHYTLPDGSSRFWRKEQIMRIHGPGFNGLTGMNPLTQFRESIGLTIAPERYQGKFFANDATPGFALSTEQSLDDDEFENILDSWNELYQGLDRAHGVAILEKGLKPVNIGVNPKDAQVFELRKFQIPELARIFRMPLHKIGYLDNATYTNIEHQAIEYYTDCLDPWLVRIEKGSWMSLLTQRDRSERYYWRHTIAGVLRGDLKSRYEAYAIGRQWGWLSANRVLELEDQDGIGPQGDIYMVPLNMVPADTVYDIEAEEVDDFTGEDDQGEGQRSARARRMLRSIVRRELPPAGCTCGGDHPLVDPGTRAPRKPGYARSADYRRRLGKRYRRPFKRAAKEILAAEIEGIRQGMQEHLGSRSAHDFSQWLATFYDSFKSTVAKKLAPVINTFAEDIQASAAEQIGAAVGITPEMNDFLENYIQARAHHHVKRSRKQLRHKVASAVENGLDVTEAVDLVLDAWEDERADRISVRETVQGREAISRHTWVLSGIQEFVWRAHGETCSFCTALDGQTAGIGHFFLTEGQEFLPEGAVAPLIPSSSIAHAPLHNGCDCTVEPA